MWLLTGSRSLHFGAGFGELPVVVGCRALV